MPFLALPFLDSTFSPFGDFHSGLEFLTPASLDGIFASGSIPFATVFANVAFFCGGGLLAIPK